MVTSRSFASGSKRASYLAALNTTPVRVGMQGRFYGRAVTVRAYMVFSVSETSEEGTKHYYWHEWELETPDGELMYLEFENGTWKLMRPFVPKTPPSLNAMRNAKSGSRLPLEGSILVQARDKATLRFADGHPSFEPTLGDTYEYIDAQQNTTLYNVQWTRDEIEFFRGQSLDERQVLHAFGLQKHIALYDSAVCHQRGRKMLAVVCLLCSLISGFWYLASGPESGFRVAHGTTWLQNIGPEGARFGPFALNPQAPVHALTVYGNLQQSSAWVQGIVENESGDKLLQAQGDFWDESGYDDEAWHESYLREHTYFRASTRGPYYVRLYAERDGALNAGVYNANTPFYGEAGFALQGGARLPGWPGWYAITLFILGALALFGSSQAQLIRWNETNVNETNR